MYPVTSLPRALRQITLINPLTYGIDAIKHVLLRQSTPPLGPEFPFLQDIMIVAITSVIILVLAALSFRRKE